MRKTIAAFVAGCLLLVSGFTHASFTSFVDRLDSLLVAKRAEQVHAFLEGTRSTPVIEGANTVHFIWYGTAESVLIEGDLQAGWTAQEPLERVDTDSGALFHKSYKLAPDTQVEYRFIVDSKLQVDRRNPLVVEHHEYGDRSLLRMPDFSPSEFSQLRTSIAKGRVTSIFFQSKRGEFSDRRLWIYTPFGYEENREYPLLLVNDGVSTLFQTRFKRVLDNMIDDERIEPLIVAFVPAVERTREYVEQDVAYASMVVHEVLPTLEDRFSIRSDASSRAIMGVSAGGHSALVTGFSHPNSIGRVASQSGCDDPERERNYGGVIASLSTYADAKDEPRLDSIYIDVGRFDLHFPEVESSLLADCRKMHSKLNQLGVEHIYVELNEGHSYSNWNERIDEILELFFKVDSNSKHRQ